MNTTKGQSAEKQHLSNGSMTACNRKSSGINKNDFKEYGWWAEKHPEVCCKKCLNRFLEKSNKQLK